MKKRNIYKDLGLSISMEGDIIPNKKEIIQKSQSSQKPNPIPRPKPVPKPKPVQNPQMVKHVEAKNLVEDALSNLEKEIGLLLQKKGSLTKNLDAVDREMEDGQELEKQLKSEMMKIENTEVKLQNDKKRLKNKLDRIQEKITKVRSIKENLKNV